MVRRKAAAHSGRFSPFLSHFLATILSPFLAHLGKFGANVGFFFFILNFESKISINRPLCFLQKNCSIFQTSSFQKDKKMDDLLKNPRGIGFVRNFH